MVRINHQSLRFLVIIGMLFLLDACAQVVHTEIQKGQFVKEEPTGKTVELERTPRIELQTPVSVRVFEEVKFGQEYDNKYEKIQVQERMYHGEKAAPERRVLRNEYMVEKTYRNFTTTQQPLTSGLVSVKVNGVIREDLAINPEGIAVVALEKYFDTYPEGQDITVDFQYKTLTASSVVPFAEAKKNALALLPTYRKAGADARSAKDHLVAYKISKDLSDLDAARDVASAADDKKEIERLYEEARDLARFEQARDGHKLAAFITSHPDSRYTAQARAILQEEKYNKYLKRNCRGTVMKAEEFAGHRTINADKGKCISFFVYKNQAAPLKAGLFQMGDNVFYIEFPAAQRNYVVSGLAQIIGEHNYMTPAGTLHSVPHLRHLPDAPTREPHP